MLEDGEVDWSVELVLEELGEVVEDDELGWVLLAIRSVEELLLLGLVELVSDVALVVPVEALVEPVAATEPVAPVVSDWVDELALGDVLERVESVAPYVLPLVELGDVLAVLVLEELGLVTLEPLCPDVLLLVLPSVEPLCVLWVF